MCKSFIGGSAVGIVADENARNGGGADAYDKLVVLNRMCPQLGSRIVASYDLARPTKCNRQFMF